MTRCRSGERAEEDKIRCLSRSVRLRVQALGTLFPTPTVSLLSICCWTVPRHKFLLELLKTEHGLDIDFRVYLYDLCT